MCISVFFVFLGPFVFGRASARTSESFFDDYGSGCKDIGFAFLVQGCRTRIEQMGSFLLAAQSTFLYYCCGQVNFTSNYNI